MLIMISTHELLLIRLLHSTGIFEMNKKTLIIITTSATLSIGALTFGATSWAKDGRKSGDRLVNRATEVLSLDDGQVEALKMLQAEISETRDLMRGEQASFMGNLSELINDESFDQQRALDSINERVNALQSNAPELVNAAAVFVDGLSSKQKATLIEKMEKMQNRRDDQHDRG